MLILQNKALEIPWQNVVGGWDTLSLPQKWNGLLPRFCFCGCHATLRKRASRPVAWPPSLLDAKGHDCLRQIRGREGQISQHFRPQLQQLESVRHTTGFRNSFTDVSAPISKLDLLYVRGMAVNRCNLDVIRGAVEFPVANNKMGKWCVSRQEVLFPSQFLSLQTKGLHCVSITYCHGYLHRSIWLGGQEINSKWHYNTNAYPGTMNAYLGGENAIHHAWNKIVPDNVVSEGARPPPPPLPNRILDADCRVSQPM